MINAYLISYEIQSEESHKISHAQLGPRAASVNFTFDSRDGWRKREEPLKVLTREKAIAEFEVWKNGHKNSLDGNAYPPIRNPQLIEKTEIVIAK